MTILEANFQNSRHLFDKNKIDKWLWKKAGIEEFVLQEIKVFRNV